MAIEKTVSELAEILGVSRQAINNRVKALPPEDTEKNEKGVTVVTRSGLIKYVQVAVGGEADFTSVEAEDMLHKIGRAHV